ncbi:hypothetical protein TNCV_4795391 [Trichonephila clavipes]|nr:hypothetical protein TNCV_4795391 [Trichonephila clavipes]
MVTYNLTLHVTMYSVENHSNNAFYRYKTDTEQADNLDNEARNSLQLSNSDAIARRKLISNPVKKHFIPELNCNRVISTIIARLRARHFKGMKISPDGQRS